MPRRTHHPLPGPIFGEPTFGEGGKVIPDPNGFETPHPSDDATYKEIQNLLTRDVVGFDASRLPDGEHFPLEQAYGPHGSELVHSIQAAGKIVFHAVGDTGASDVRKYKSELHVADAMTAEARTAAAAERPAFFFHLGDIVYNFGESTYYYDEFYDPFRNYPRPIFAIPGNHDSFIVPGTAAADEPLRIFGRNFCALQPTLTPEVKSLHRTAMTQPGVYFTLDAPFVRIIGLFSNALEDPGVISSEKGHWADVPDLQLGYLRAQLERIRKDRYPGAVLIAVHHPPFSYRPKGAGGTGAHGGSSAMLKQIDDICLETGVYPHAFLSGHAHNYQRYTRNVRLHAGAGDFEVPFVVCGSGGHNVNPLVFKDFRHTQDPGRKIDVSHLDADHRVSQGLRLENYDDFNFGYLRLTVDARHLTIAFNPIGDGGGLGPDSVTVDLATRKLA